MIWKVLPKEEAEATKGKVLFPEMFGIILFFFMSKVDANEKDIKEVKANYEPTKAHEKDVKAMNEKLETIEKDVKGFKDTYLEKEEFIRSMAEINRKFDRMDDKSCIMR